MRRNKIVKLVLSGLFLALAFVLPFLTGQVPEIGNMLCPMHIPVILCGFICGWPYGCLIGFIAPILRSLILGMPPMFPKAICMAVELATYGFTAGLTYKLLPKKKGFIYLSLIISMLVGRAIWGGAMYLCLFTQGNAFTISAFVASAFTNAIPGIILQIILIPIIVMIYEKVSPHNK
ncbi:MAG: ECF transporter S component [Clostridia bacterium]|nr:ECF transporter S component [Clostridia bacterium]